MSSLAIRVAGHADATALAALIAGFRDHLRAKTPSDADLARLLPRSLADPALEFACAWLADEAVGFTQTIFLSSVWACGVEAHLEDLYVVPAARGRDVGRALLRHALDRAEARGARRLSLNTNEGNVAAQSLYRSEGLAPQTHALYPGGREVLWAKEIGAAKGST